jgi:hypothetical protein
MKFYSFVLDSDNGVRQLNSQNVRNLSIVCVEI